MDKGEITDRREGSDSQQRGLGFAAAGARIRGSKGTRQHEHAGSRAGAGSMARPLPPGGVLRARDVLCVPGLCLVASLPAPAPTRPPLNSNGTPDSGMGDDARLEELMRAAESAEGNVCQASVLATRLLRALRARAGAVGRMPPVVRKARACAARLLVRVAREQCSVTSKLEHAGKAGERPGRNGPCGANGGAHLHDPPL